MKRPRPHEIVAATCAVYGITRGELLGRLPAHVEARAVFAYVARQCGHKWHVIAEAVLRDHSTVLVAAGDIERLLARNCEDIADKVAAVTAKATTFNRQEARCGAIDPVLEELEIEKLRDRRSSAEEPAHITWGCSRPLAQQNADFARAMQEVYGKKSPIASASSSDSPSDASEGTTS